MCAGFQPNMHLMPHTEQLNSELLADFLNVERKLALLKGWTEIVRIGSSFLGNPPAGAHSCRGQAQVPRWCRDWNATGPLIGEHDIDILNTAKEAVSTYSEGDAQWLLHDVPDFPSKDAALRYAIVIGAITQLERIHAAKAAPATPSLI
jgi:hypothetical protein